MNSLVYITILNWNTCEDTIDCVESCQKLNYPNFRILLIDNGSTDGSEQRLRKLFPDIEIIQTGKNYGYAKGNNIGIRSALKKGADFVWVVNPDVIVERDSLKQLVKVFHDDERMGICGPRIIQGRPQDSYCFDGVSIYPELGYPIRFNLVKHWHDNTVPSVVDVDFVSGCSMLIRSKLLYDIGLVREEFFLYFDDVELSFRARKYGWRTAVYRQTLVTHRRGTNKRPVVPNYAHIERSGVLFAKTQKRFVFKTVVTSLNLRKLKVQIRKRGFRVASKYFFVRIRGVVSGLFAPLRPIPSA